MRIPLLQLLIAGLSGCVAAAPAGPGPDAFGNEIPDFSMAGYRHGGVALPVAPVVERLRPAACGADDSERIQAAIQLAARVTRQGGNGAAAVRAVTIPEQAAGTVWALLQRRYQADRPKAKPGTRER